jgi:signal peptidase I
VLNQIMDLLAMLFWPLLPLGAAAVLDDWLLRPRRRISALPAIAADPAWARVCHAALPVFVVAGVIRVLRSERLDFSLVLVLVTLIGGVIWLIDHWWFRPARERAVSARGSTNAMAIEPGIVDYARSMVPVVLAVLVLRSFLFEPFRIPSDSMMPTLQDGDFILVNKYMYGLRLPVVNRKILDIGEPKRGDVVVFRYPPDPAINYIKRLIGLPGDRVRIETDRVYVNGKMMPSVEKSRYSDGCYENMVLSEEQVGEHVHRTLSCPTPFGIGSAPLPGCNRRIDRGYICPSDVQVGQGQGADSNDFDEVTVPAGHYLMIGDNRDNSSDGRVWGFVPEENLVGSARRIWFNWDLKRTNWVTWNRIFQKID